MKQKLSFLVLATMSATLASYQVHYLKETERLVIPVSKDNLNRLKMERDRFKDIFGDEGYEVVPETSQGQLFMRFHEAKPIYASLISERGMTQDVVFKPILSEPQTIVFKEMIDTEIKEPKGQRLRRLMATMMKDQGGETVRVFKGPFKGLTTVSAKRFKEGPFEGIAFRVLNETDQAWTLNEKTLIRPTVCAVHLETKRIKPGQEITVRLIMEKDMSA